MVKEKEITFEKPDNSGIKLCLRHAISFISLTFITAILLYLIVNKENLDILFKEYSSTQNLILIGFAISIIGILASVFMFYKDFTKTRKYYVPWDTIQFTWIGVVLMLLFITCC